MIIIATAVLHNIARDMGEEEPPEDNLDPHRVNINDLILQDDILREQLPHDVEGNVNNFRANIINNYFANL